MKNISAPILAVDFEGSKKIGVVEFGAAKIEHGEITQVYTSLCAPTATMSAADARFIGIQPSDAAKCAPFSAYLNTFCNLRRTCTFASHNACVEDSFLRCALPSPGKVPDFTIGGECTQWGPWLDTCTLVRNLYPQIASAGLADCIGALSLDSQLLKLSQKFCAPQRRKWHCAPFDALACALIIIAICNAEGFENASLQWLAKYGGNPDLLQTYFA